MSRRSQAPKRTILPDPKYSSDLLAKFMNMIMNDGKKSVAERIIYGALDRIAEKETQTDDKALELLESALENVKPVVEVKSRRVGGATYQVPVEVRPARRQTLAMRWVIDAARRRGEKSMETHIVWRKPTRHFRTTAGEPVSLTEYSRNSEIKTWPAQLLSSAIAILASWPILMRARPRLQNAYCSTRASLTR
jgi:small subunit ribosomal protein S7